MRSFINWNRNVSRKIIHKLDSIFGSVSESEIFFYQQFDRGSLEDKTVLEIGGTSRPLLSKNEVKLYLGLDIDKDFEFDNFYHRYFAQSCELWNDEIRADVIFSKYLIEHVPDNHKTFQNIENWLNAGGKSVHIFPLGYHPFSLLNRLVGNSFAKKVIPILRPGTEAITGYPAFYHLCNSLELTKLIKSSKLNYKVKYFYGAEDYFSFFFPISISVYFFNRLCAFFNFSIFASNAVLVIEK